MVSKSESPDIDFSQPWKLSDVVLVVEEETFHVHRQVLALWSPVFDKMFTSEFKEKDKNEVPLPGKKASEIREMLLLIYPSVAKKVITEGNCYFLVKLAHEYQMEALFKRCEDFMAHIITNKSNDKVLTDLVFAQTYELEKLKLASVKQAHCLSLEELKKDKVYDQIQSGNLKEIMEGIIKRLQRDLEEARRLVREKQETINRLNKMESSTYERSWSRRDDRDRPLYRDDR
ncbi:BTB and MATH domain-containing protein 38-like [Oculina patagonica]